MTDENETPIGPGDGGARTDQPVPQENPDGLDGLRTSIAAAEQAGDWESSRRLKADLSVGLANHQNRRT
jgi:hypothetical protein